MLTTAQRSQFMSLVEQSDDGCWIWTGALRANGYGFTRIGGSWTLAHRLSFRLFRGEIPLRHVLHHRCEVRRCVNPSHLEAVTRREHSLRHLADACSHGHPFDEANTYHFRGTRHCRACGRDRQARRRVRLAERLA